MSRTKMMAAFHGQKQRARRKNISFNFTFKQWCIWWETQLGSDWFTLRGNRSGQYVMARNGDEGPYHPDNVRCITCNENHREAKINIRQDGEHHPRAKLTQLQARAIKNSTKSKIALAEEYNVSPITINQIRNGTRWKCLDR